MSWLSKLFGYVKKDAENALALAAAYDTEFMCEVVEVAEVLPHPNADKLEILHLRGKNGALGYTVVDRKGREVGDKVAYIGVDTVVPTNREEFKFLKERLDGQGKDYFRIRAARIRGTYSEGLVVDCPSGFNTLGASLVEHFAVTYHNPDKFEYTKGPSQPQPKKDWRRNLIPEYGVVSLRKAPYLFQEGEPCHITEKIHGTNFRFGWVKHGLRWHFVVGSHRTFKSDNRGWFRRLVNATHGRGSRGSWYGNDLYSGTAEALDLKNASWDARGVIFYGEIFGKTEGGQPIQDLTYGRTRPDLRIFDAWDTKTRSYLPRGEMVRFANYIGLGTAPLIDVPSDAQNLFSLDRVKRLAEEDTVMSHDDNPIREGVVVSTDDGRRGKWVSERYRMRKDA